MSKEITVAQVADKALDKASDLVATAANSASDIFQAAAGIVTKGVEQYGPQVIDAVLWVVRIDAIQQLVFGWAIVILSAVIIYLINFSKGKLNLWQYGKVSEGFSYVVCVFATLGAVAPFFLSGLPKVTDVWLYTAVAKPEVYLVKRTIEIVEHRLSVPPAK